MRYIYTIFILITLSGCNSSPNYMNTAQLKSNHQILGLGGFYVEEELSYFEQQLADHYKTPIKKALEDRGFQVVDASEVYDLYYQLLDNADNLYDPLTGQENENLRNEIWKKALAKTKAKLGISAFVFAGVDTVRAEFTNSIILGHVAKWYGQEESYLEGGADGGDIFVSLFQNEEGYVPGSRLYIRIRDEHDTLLTTGSGGIELVAQFNSDEEIIVKDADKLFKDPTKLDNALQFALKTIDTWKTKK